MRWARRLARGLGWAVLSLLLVFFLLLLPLAALLGSDHGSRWLIQQALGLQHSLSLDVEGGDLLDGLRLRNVHMRGKSYDIYINRVLLRWTLSSALHGQLQIDQLRLEQFRLVLKGPAKPGPVKLPVLPLPFELVLNQGEVIEGGIESHGHYEGLDSLNLVDARWFGTRLSMADLSGSRRGLGLLHLKGGIDFHAQYPIDASGQLQLDALGNKGLGPLHVQLAHDLDNLVLVFDSQGKLPVHLAGNVHTLSSGLPFQAWARWSAFTSPWLPAQALSTAGGKLAASGTLSGLESTGSTNIAGSNIPKGRYDWNVQTDWKKITVKNLLFKGLGGQANVNATASLANGSLVWQAEAKLKQLNLAQKWPAAKMGVPVLTGTLKSQGRATASASAIGISADLAGGESWRLTQQGQGWPWSLQAWQQINLGWNGVRRQLPGLGPVSSANGSLSYTGTLASYRLTVDSQFVSPRTPVGLWHVDAAGKGQQLVLQRVDYDGDIGTVSFAGRVQLGHSLRWQGVLALQDLQTGWLLPEWQGQFSGSLSGQGSWGPGNHALVLDSVHLSGQLRDKPLKLDGGLHLTLLTAPGAWPQLTLQEMQGTWGQDQFLLQGGLDQDWQLRVDAKLHDLALLDPGLGGQLNTQFTVSGPEKQPSGDVHLDVHDFTGFRTTAQTLTVDAHIVDFGRQASTLRASGSGLSVFGQAIDSATLSLDGTRDIHDLQWQLSANTLAAEGELHGHEDASTASWSGSLVKGSVHLPGMDWVLDSAATLGFVPAEHSLHIGPHCWTSAAAHLCNVDELLAGPAGHARLRLTDLDAARLQPWLPDGMSLKATVSGNGDANWQSGELPEVSLNLLTKDGTIALSREEDQPPLQFDYKLMALSAFIQPDSWRLRFDMLSPSIGNGYADVTLDPRTSAYALSGSTSLQGVQMEVFRAFLPALSSLSGQLSAQGQFSGVLKEPQFAGQVKLNNGQLTVREAPVNLHDINVVADIKGQQVTINGQAGSGKGNAVLKGEALWGDQPHLNFTLTGQDFEVKQLPMLDARLNPDLSFNVVPGQVNINGQIKVPYATLDIKALPEKAVPLSPDVVVVSEDTRRSRMQLSTAMQSWLINANIELLLGDEVSFRGFGVTGRLGGNLHLVQHGNRGLQATGEVELQKNARYNAYGQNLDITRGRLIFAGPLTQPGVDLEASKVVDTKTVGIRVSGRANAPQVDFFSDADLSQSDILSYIVLGRPMYQNGQLNVLCSQTVANNKTTTAASTAAAASSGCAQSTTSTGDLALATAAIKLGSSSGGEGLAGRIGGVFGIQDVAVGAESTTDDTQFTVSGYINPKLYLSYGVGVFTPVNTVKIRYNITPRLYLEGVSSLENAIDIYYNFKF